MQALLAGCLLAVIAAVWTRAGIGWPQRRGLRGSAVAASVALPIALVAWLPGGPLAASWARRAGTPLVASTTGSANTVQSGQSSPVAAFSAPVTGSVNQRALSGGGVEVDISLAISNAALGAVNVRIDGNAAAGGGVQMTGSSVAIGTPSNPALYQGTITALDGTQIAARVTSADGRTLQLELALRLGTAGSATGTVSVTPA